MDQAATTGTVTILYFAQFREEAGTSRETVRIPPDRRATAETIFDQVCSAHGFSLGKSVVRPAINGAYAQWNDPVQPDDELVFIPPVAGG